MSFRLYREGCPPPPPHTHGQARKGCIRGTLAVSVPGAGPRCVPARRGHSGFDSFLAPRHRAGSAISVVRFRVRPPRRTRFRARCRVGSAAVLGVAIGAGRVRRRACAFSRFRRMLESGGTPPRTLAVANASGPLSVRIPLPRFGIGFRIAGHFRLPTRTAPMPNDAGMARNHRLYSRRHPRGRCDWGMGNVRVRFPGIRRRPVRGVDSPCPGGRRVMEARHDAKRDSAESGPRVRAPLGSMPVAGARSGLCARRFSTVARKIIHVHLQGPRDSIAAGRCVGVGDGSGRISRGCAAAGFRGSR